MGFLRTISIWWSLKKAKKEESKHIPSKKEILSIAKDLKVNEKKLKDFYLKNTFKKRNKKLAKSK